MKIKETTELRARADNLKSRSTERYDIDDLLDAWRYLDTAYLRDVVWGNQNDNTYRPVVLMTNIRSVMTTVRAFLGGTRPPKIRVEPDHSLQLGDLKRANFNERIGMLLFEELNAQRSVPLEAEAVDYGAHRARIIGILDWRADADYEPPAQREREVPELPEPELEEAPPAEGDILSLIGRREDALISERPAGTGEDLSQYSSFPLSIRFVDGRECAYLLDRDYRCVELVHEYETTWDQIVAQWPDIEDMSAFTKADSKYTADSLINVVDYWDAEINAIMVDNQWYKKPTKHHFTDDAGKPMCPVVIEEVDNESRPVKKKRVKRPHSFCEPILDAMKWASWAESVTAAVLANTAFNVIVHYGIDQEGNSPYIVSEPGEDGREEFLYLPPEGYFDISPDARVWPGFGNERFEYLDPPRVVDVMQEFKAGRMRDIRINTFDESILSGTTLAEPSGYAISLSRQAAMARIEPLRQHVERFISRVLEMALMMLRQNWDNGVAERLPYRLREADVELTSEMVELAGTVKVTIVPDVQIDDEAKKKVLFDSHARGVASDLTVIDHLQLVDDPQSEIERIAFEQYAKQDPATMAALAQNYMKKNKIGAYADDAPQAQPAPQADPAAMAAIPAMAGAAQAAGVPPGGGMPGAPPGMAGMGGGAPQGPPGGAQSPAGLPPELAQLMQQNPTMLMQLLQGGGGGGIV